MTDILGRRAALKGALAASLALSMPVAVQAKPNPTRSMTPVERRDYHLRQAIAAMREAEPEVLGGVLVFTRDGQNLRALVLDPEGGETRDLPLWSVA